MANSNPNWTSEELTLALAAYLRVKAGADKKAESRSLSRLLNELEIHHPSKRLSSFRDQDGVRRRLDHFKMFDERPGAIGPKRYREIWEKYAGAPAKLSEAVNRIRETHRVSSKQVESNISTASLLRQISEAVDDDIEKLQRVARRIRRGQAALRRNLLHLYQHKCAISDSGPTCVLEAAHIQFHSTSGINHTENGILLRADLHLLFDDNLLRIRPDTLEVYLDESLRCTPYWDFHGQTLRSRTDGSMPNKEYLQGRWKLCARTDSV